MSQPPQSPDAPGTTDVDSGVDSLTDEATSDVERAAAQAADDRSEHSGPPDDQDADDTDYDDDYRAPVVVAPLPGASSGPVQGGRRVSTPQAAEAPRPHRSALSLAAMASVAVAGLNPTRLALPQSETPERHIIGVIDTQGRHWEVHEARTDAVGASLEAEAEVLRRIGRVVDDGRLSFDVLASPGPAAEGHSHPGPLPRGGQADPGGDASTGARDVGRPGKGAR